MDLGMDTPRIIKEVSNALDAMFEGYDWANLIDDLDLTKEEKNWANANLMYKVAQV